MTDLTGKFADLEAQLATQAETMGNYVDEVEGKLDLLNAQIDTLNLNGAANTRYLLDALAKIDPCATCPPPSITIPPVGGTTSPISADKCKRAQAFIAFMESAMVMLDLASGLGTGTFPSLLLSAYQEVIDSSDNYAGVPLISFSEGASLIGSIINYAILNIGRADTLSAQFSTIATGMLPVLYSSTSASEAQANYAAYVSSSGLPGDEIDVMVKAGYNSLFTWFFDPSSDPVLTPYSGTACGAFAAVCDDSSSCPFNPGSSNFVAKWLGTLLEPNLEPSQPLVFDQGLGEYAFTTIDSDPYEVVTFLKAGGGVAAFTAPHTLAADPDRFCYTQKGVAYTARVCFTPAGT